MFEPKNQPNPFVHCRYLDRRILLRECNERQEMRQNFITLKLKAPKKDDVVMAICEDCPEGQKRDDLNGP